jgi:hypothetical protein
MATSAGTVIKHAETKRMFRENAAKFFVSWLIEVAGMISNYAELTVLFFVFPKPQCSSA